MEKRTRGYTLVAAALLMLAACGQDSGTHEGASSSGKAPNQPDSVGAPNAHIAKPSAAEPDGLLGQDNEIELATRLPPVEDVLDPTAEADSTPQTKAVRDNAWHLNSNTVSAELLAAMLLQNGKSMGAQLDDDLDFVPAPEAPTAQGSNQVDASGASPVVKVGTGVWPDTENGAYLPREFVDFRDFTMTGTTLNDFTDTEASLPVTLDATSRTGASHADGSINLQPLASLATGTRILALGTPMTVTMRTRKPEPIQAFDTEWVTRKMEIEDAGSSTLAPQLPGRLRAGQRVGYRRALQTWTRTSEQSSSANEVAQLFVQNDSEADRARLCLSIRNATLRRMSCSIWQLPPNWQPGTPITYRGHYVSDATVDDARVRDDVYRWQTLPPASATHTPVKGTAPTKPASAAISNEGISGEVLATMLTQALPASASLWPWDADGPNGKRLTAANAQGPDAPAYRTLNANFGTSFTAPMNTPAFDRSLWTEYRTEINHLPGPLPFLPNQAVTLKLHLTANIGEFTKDASGKTTGFSLKGLQEAAAGTPILSLVNNVYTTLSNVYRSDGDRRINPVTIAMPINTTYTDKAVNKGELYPFDEKIQAWTMASTHSTVAPLDANLVLRRGADPRQAWLCLNVAKLSQLDRRTCTIWNVPQDWQPGQPLTYAGTHVGDFRSWAQPGATSERIWWMGTPE